MFYDKYVHLCSKKGLSPSAAAEEMGYQRSVVTRWSKGTAPRDATMHRVADYFGVNVSYFKDEEKTVTIESDGLSELDLKFVSLIKQLTDQEKAMLIAQIEGLLQLRGQ